ncbi:MAG TPA: glycosyltransferase family 4 protein [Vicinamibacterales bacterium]|nr:glycosyltransferase family 4 protein [Vicinamibacterales bacterium]
MRIGLVVTGGVDESARERVVPALLWLVERLARRHDVHVFVLHYHRTPRSYPLLGATVHDLGRVDGPPGFRRLRVTARLRHAVAAHGPFDILHAYLGMPAAVATRVGRMLRAPVVVTFDSGELVAIDDIGYGLQRRPMDRLAIAAALRRADRVTVCTTYTASMPALGNRPVDVVPIGVDPARFPSTPRADGPPWRLLRVASLNHVKDYPMLLRAMTSIAAALPETHLDIVGEDTLCGAVQAQSGALGLDRRVTFHGFQPSDALAGFYARAHVHLMSSRHEAASVAMLEAACAGVPTVGTRVGYATDWATEGRAVAVPVGDADALANATIALLRHPSHREQVASAARAWTLAHDADWTAAEFERIYGELRGDWGTGGLGD